MKWRGLAAMAAYGVLVAGTAMAEDKWGAHIDLEGKAGTKRNLGEADLFLPMAQNATSLLFADIRTRMDDQDSREGNFGLGIRHMLDSGWNLGGYGYFDRRRSEYDNFFNQATLGAEVLSQDWDFRLNGYLPVGRRTYSEDRFNTAEISGTNVLFRGGEERSLGGFDAEIGWRAPVFAADAGQQLRLYGGGYRFSDEGVPDVAGPRGRAELVFDEVPGLWEGSRLALGAELQHDDPRGTQGFVSARLRIPLQVESKASKLSPMEQRMTDPIVRDIDVVAQAGTFGAAETTNQLASGGAFTVLSSAITTTTADLQNALNAAGASTVILSGTFNTNATVAMQGNQTLIGGGTVAMRSQSGRTAALSLPGATIAAGLNATASALQMAGGSRLIGMTVTNASDNGAARYGVDAQNSGGIVISGSTISVTVAGGGAIAVDARMATGVIDGNTISAVSTAGAGAIALQTDSAPLITVADNTFIASSTGAKYVITGNQWTGFGAGSTGNVAVSGVCTFAPGSPATSVGFSNISCP